MSLVTLSTTVASRGTSTLRPLGSTLPSAMVMSIITWLVVGSWVLGEEAGLLGAGVVGMTLGLELGVALGLIELGAVGLGLAAGLVGSAPGAAPGLEHPTTSPTRSPVNVTAAATRLRRERRIADRGDVLTTEILSFRTFGPVPDSTSNVHCTLALQVPLQVTNGPVAAFPSWPARPPERSWLGSTVDAPPHRSREDTMPQRLTPLEVSLLVLDTAHTPAHIGTDRHLRRGAGRLGLRAAARPDPRAHQLRPALSPAGARRARSPRRARMGGRRELRSHVSRAALGAAASRDDGTTPRVRRPGSRASPRPVATVVGDVRRRGPGAQPVRPGGQIPSQPGRRDRRGRPRTGAVRHAVRERWRCAGVDRGVAPHAGTDRRRADRRRPRGRARRIPPRRWRTSAAW